jgi:hypothetical protein
MTRGRWWRTVIGSYRPEFGPFGPGGVGYLVGVPVELFRLQEVTMRTYERPTLTRAGSFAKLTGLGGSGPKDVLGRHQSL